MNRRRVGVGFCNWQADQVDRAARKLATQFGFGSSWLASMVAARRATEDEPAEAGLSVARRARSRPDGTGGPVLPKWKLDKGLALVPTTRTRVEESGDLAFAGISRQSFDLLLAFGCEDPAAWMRVEAAMLTACASPSAAPAVRDAMARIMFRRAGVPLEARARELHMRAGDYRATTRAAETLLRARLVEASVALNAHASNNVRGRPSTLPAPKEVGPQRIAAIGGARDAGSNPTPKFPQE